MEFCNTVYKVNSSYDIIKNEKILNDIYLPIIGKDALSLYNEFFLLTNNMFNSFKNVHSDLIKKYNLTKDEFIIIRKKLEAIGLLNTYYDELKEEYTYYLFSNLTYKDFMNCEKLKLVLLNKIGETELRKLQYKYENNFQDINQLNLSENILYLLDDQTKEQLFRFNFSKLYLDLITILNFNFNLELELKEYIEYIYTQYSLEYKEILDLCLSAFDVEYKTLNKLLLEAKLEILLNEKRKQEIQIHTKITRKKELFFSHNKVEEYDNIVDDYRKFSCENYLISLTKEKLNNNKINFINKLRNDFDLDDYQINVIFDFALFKNNGRFIPQYIEAICKDVWQNDIQNISDIIDKLRASIVGIKKPGKKQNIKNLSNPDANSVQTDILSILEIAGVTNNG